MIAIASLLDPSANAKTKEIWGLLEQLCGLSGFRLAPLPHFTWQSAENYLLGDVEPLLQAFTADIAPFELHTTGLGVFTGRSPILYLPIVKSQYLVDLHHRLWEILSVYGVGSNNHYAPSGWVPHITLAYRDTTPENLACAVQNLSQQDLHLTLRVDHISVLYQFNDNDGIRSRFNFLSGSKSN